ncbi:hypothetical protein OHA21_10475 [Actinoplanes sp. NBC_00393]|uniref:hypothetical protein n=1 Tax=Actinoplanes sp. NBC_00393 TaxID=2975953 RepID=UPI002E1F74CD
MHDALGQIANAAERLGVDEQSVRDLRHRLSGMPLAYRAGYTTSAVQSALVRAAVAHDADCARRDCATCDGLRAGLTVALAGTRLMVDEELAEMFEAPVS